MHLEAVGSTVKAHRDLAEARVRVSACEKLKAGAQVGKTKALEEVKRKEERNAAAARVAHDAMVAATVASMCAVATVEAGWLGTMKSEAEIKFVLSHLMSLSVSLC